MPEATVTLDLVLGGLLAVPRANDEVVRRFAEAGHHPKRSARK
jgi:hypothetical protein